MGKITAGILWVLACLAIIVGAVIGWMLNIFHVIGYIGSDTTDTIAEVGVRIVGIFVPFIGAIAGYF